jgi:hypothetical protein
MRPGSLGEVVSIRAITTSDQVQQFGASIGTKVYTIEFGDGVSIEVPERWLEKIAT